MGQAVTANEEPDLSPKQRAFAEAFVRAKIEGLDLPNYDLARAAGYIGTEEALRVSASRTLANPKVRAYIHQQAREHMRDGGMDVAVALRELTAQRDDKRVRLDAAKAVGLAIGLTGREETGGPALVLNLVLGNGAALVQAPGDAAQVIEAQRESRAARSLVQGERARPPVRMITAPPLALASATGGRGVGGGDFAGAAEETGGHPSHPPPQTVGVVEGDVPKISGVSKPAKVVRSARASGSRSAAKSVKGGAVAKSRTSKGKSVRAKPKGKP
jgi:hypothetical protein